MRAVVIDRFGGPEEMYVAELADPVPGPGQILVDVAYAGINPLDYKIRDGSNRLAQLLTPEDFPLVLGEECSGTVAALGDDVEGFEIGDRVFGMVAGTHGCYAQKVAVPANLFAKVDADADLKVLGGTALAGLTAWAAIHTFGRVTADDVVLVHGGGGGVGQFIVQLARQLGAEVWATASVKHAEKFARWGVHHIDYATEDFETAMPHPSVIIDGVYFGTYERNVALLNAGERLVVLPSLADLTPAKEKSLDVSVPSITRDPEILAQLAGMIQAGTLDVIVSEVFPLAEAADAHRLVETGHAEGKIVLDAR